MEWSRVERHRKDIRYIALSYTKKVFPNVLRDKDLFESVLTDVYVEIAKYPESKFQQFKLSTIVSNTFRWRLAKYNRKDVSHDDLIDVEFKPDKDMSLYDDLLPKLREVIPKLSSKHQLILNKYLECDSYTETAKYFGKSRQCIEQTMQLIRRNIRNLMAVE